MRAGKLRNNVAIQQNTPTRSSSGESIDSWSDFAASWWCELATVSGGETFRSKQVHAQADTLAIGRYVSGVTPQMRVTYGSRTFDILLVDDVEQRHRELRLHLRERGI